MKFKMEVNMDNAAFDEKPERELSVVLADVIRAFLIDGKIYGNCMNCNGNTIGHLGISTNSKEVIDDKSALDAAAAILDGEAWNADTTDAIATIIRKTGRKVSDI